jgi:hypothetical protein
VTTLFGRLVVVGCVVSVSCSAPVPVEDAGQMESDAGVTNDAGSEDGGTSSDAGEEDGGFDAGCVGTTAAQLAIVSAPQMIDAKACSAPLKVQLQTACGTPVNAGADLPIDLTATIATTEFFGDLACIGKPSVFVIPAGADSLEVYFRDVAPGMTTISVTAAGVDAGSQVQTLACAAGEKACNGNSCIPVAQCCTDADCVAPRSICKAGGVCGVPPCSGFVNGCTSFVPYDGGTITLGSPFAPKCVSASSNASVKYSGTFHTLEQTCGPKDLNISKFGSVYTVTGQSSFATYGFHCGAHNSTFEVGALKHN